MSDDSGHHKFAELRDVKARFRTKDDEQPGFGPFTYDSGLGVLKQLVEFVGPEAVIDAVQEVCEDVVSQTRAVFCVPCRRKLKVDKVGQEVVELTAEGGTPYKAMTGDVLGCPGCGAQVVLRWSRVTPCHEPEFDAKLRGFRRLGILEVV